MKKTTLMLGCLIAGGLMAADKAVTPPPPPPPPKMDLLATAEVAPFTEVAKKTMTLGALVGNPMLPTLLVGSAQESLKQAYGRFRSDAPIYVFMYGEPPPPPPKKAGANACPPEPRIENVMVYPSADGPAKMLLEHPGATKTGDGVLHLLPGNGGATKELWVKFTADNRMCAMATCADLARRAVVDFEAGAGARAARGSAVRPLVRLDVLPAGLGYLAACARETGTGDRGWAKFASLTGMFDLDEKGVTCALSLLPRPGVPPAPAAGYALPAGVLDLLPGNAPVFMASGARLGCGMSAEPEYRAELEKTSAAIRRDFVDAIVQSEYGKNFATLAADIMPALDELLRRGAPYPAATDWNAAALAADPAHHLYVVSKGEQAESAVAFAATTKFLDDLGRAFDKRWPGRRCLVKTPKGFLLDLDILSTALLRESKMVEAEECEKTLADLRKAYATMLGDTKIEIAYANEGPKASSLIAAPGVMPPPPAPKCEARFAAALPEIAGDRPGLVGFIGVYALLRDIILPVQMALADDAKSADDVKGMLGALPASSDTDGLVFAVWARRNGSWQGLVRITAGELRNFGVTFNAFTAAAMSSALGKDDDDNAANADDDDDDGDDDDGDDDDDEDDEKESVR